MSPTPTSIDAVPGPVAAFLDDVAIGPPQTRGRLTLWPLLRGAVPDAAGASPSYVPIHRALRDGSLRVDEVSDAGAVPFVRITNDGRVPVLVLFGEELVGAKQNRVTNATFLVSANSSLVIDVSCVEYGRWERPRGQRFEAPERVVSNALRKKMSFRVAQSRARGRRFVADQLEVWDEVGERIEQAAASAPTGAYSDYVRHRAVSVDEILDGLEAAPGQVGFVSALDDRIEGVEGVGDPGVFAQVFPSLLRSYAIDASEGSRRSASEAPPPDESRVASFLEALARAPHAASPSLGEGRDLRIESPLVRGCALDCGGLVHLMAFPSSADPSAPEDAGAWAT